MCEICKQYPCPPACPNHVPEIYTICDECGGEIYEGEEYYIIRGSNFCSDCIDRARTEATDE